MVQVKEAKLLKIPFEFGEDLVLVDNLYHCNPVMDSLDCPLSVVLGCQVSKVCIDLY